MMQSKMSKFIQFENTGFVSFDECNTPTKNKIFSETINKYHSYMKAKDTCNRRINWLVYENSSGNLIGALGINSAILAMSVRDNFIGWNKEQKRANLNKIGNNYRFCLIKDNITEDNIGTKVLKEYRIQSAIRWKEKYGDDLVLIETLVKPPWSGAVYKADNWLYCGMTKGFSFSKAPVLLWQKEKSARGDLTRENPKAAIEKYAVGNKQYNIVKSEPKLVFVKPLVKNWREILKTY
jgi:hypothetical protein